MYKATHPPHQMPCTNMNVTIKNSQVERSHRKASASAFAFAAALAAASAAALAAASASALAAASAAALAAASAAATVSSQYQYE